MDVSRRTRAERLAMPLAREVVKDLAVEHGACIRPVQLRRTSLDTGAVEQVLVPCGHTLAAVCPACAQRAKTLRAAQCREGWHLEAEPVIDPDPATEDQKWWVEKRAEAQAMRDQADADDQDIADLDALNNELDQEITAAGMRGNVLPARPQRRHRTTRRRQDAAAAAPPQDRGEDDRQDLHRPGRQDVPAVDVPHPHLPQLRPRPRGRHPGRPGQPTTTSRRPAMPCTSRRCSTGSSRTCAGSSATTSNTSPPSNPNGGWHPIFTWPCAAPSPAPSCAAFWRRPITRCGGRTPPSSASTATTCPCGMSTTGTYLDPATGEVLPTWDDALDAIGDQDEPLHVARFGERFDAQGVLAGSKDAARCIGYLTKYLTKQVADCHQATTDTQRAHVERLAEALRYEPCSPRCANWLRYGVQPKNARPGLIPGACKGKAHRREYLGYAGRRVLVSRKWSGKTLADHRADRKNWLLATLGQATDPARYSWEPVIPGDPDHMEHARRLLHVVADRQRWQASLAEARRRAGIELPSDLSATGRAA